MSSAGWRPTADEIAAELCRARAERVMAGLPVRVSTDAEALAAWLAGRAAPVGVTSSDERLSFDDDVEAVANRIGLSLGQRAAVSDLVTDVVDRVLALPVPSSDEPEGDGAEAHSIAQWLAFEENGDWRYDPGNPAFDGYLARARKLAAHLAKFRAARPAPVGDAEPVQWGLEDESGEIVGTARMRDDAESLAAELLGGLDLKVVPLYRLPVSSQDAGDVRLDGRVMREELLEAEASGARDEMGNSPSAVRLAELQRRRVDLVLPAEGERRDELIVAVHNATGAGCPWIASVYDALRDAAAGKAGSDDA